MVSIKCLTVEGARGKLKKSHVERYDKMPEIKFNDERVLMAFVDQMITDKDAGIEASARAKLRDELYREMSERIERGVLDALPDQALIDLDGALDSGMTDEEIEEFFEGSGVNFGEVAARTMKKFRDDYLSGALTPATKMKEEA